MAPDVFLRKRTYLRQLLADLEILHASLAPAYEDFAHFLEVLESQ